MGRQGIALTGMGLCCGPFATLQDLSSLFCPPVAWENPQVSSNRSLPPVQEATAQAFQDSGLGCSLPAELGIGLFTAGARPADISSLWPAQGSVQDQALPSSLAALAQGVQAVRAGTCDLAVVVGLFPPAAPAQEAEACAACVVLQPLETADPRRIWSVVRDVSLPEPKPPAAQASPVWARLAQNIDLQTVSLVLTNRENQSRTSPDLGSFPPRKELAQRFAFDLSDLGPEAAGLDLTGVIVLSLALKRWLIPVTARENLGRSETEKGFVQTTGSHPWFRSGLHSLRRAGIGTPRGGAILEEHPQGPEKPGFFRPGQAEATWNQTLPTEIFFLSGQTKEELLARMDALRSRVQDLEHPPAAKQAVCGRELARELAAAEHHSYRLTLIAKSFADLSAKLDMTREKIAGSSKERLRVSNQIQYGYVSPEAGEGKTVFLFPGQGSQYPGLLADLYAHFPQFKEWIAAFDQISGHLDQPHLPVVAYPPDQGLNSAEQEFVRQAIHKPDIGGLCTILSSQALCRLLQSFGVRAEAMLGHSNGENTALVASGTMDLDLDGVIRAILQIQQISQDAEKDEAVKGRTIAVSITNTQVFHQLLQEEASEVFWTMDNCPHQAVLFGPEEKINALTRALSTAGGICTRLPFDIGFHTSLLQEYQTRLRAYYASEPFIPGHTPLYSSIICGRYPSDPESMRDLAAKHWTHKVRFRETVEFLYQEGFRHFIEVGPSNLLTSFVQDTLRGKPHVAIASNVKNLSGLFQIQRLMAECYVRGLPLDPEKLFVPQEPGPDRTKNRPQPEPQEDHEQAHGEQADSAPGRAGAADQAVRSAIACRHFELMNDFLHSQARVFAALFGSNPEQVLSGQNLTRQEVPAPEQTSSPERRPDQRTSGPEHAAQTQLTPGRFPLLTDIQVDASAGSLQAMCHLDIGKDLFLLHHCLGRLSDDQELSALPVVPFSFSMEIAAEAAAAMCGGRQYVTAMHNVRGHRWLTLNDGRMSLMVAAWEAAGSTAKTKETEVKLYLPAQDQHSRPEPVFEARVQTADRFTPPEDTARASAPIHQAGPREAGNSPRWDPHIFYERCMFHGPKLHGIHRLSHINASGFQAELKVLPADGFFTHTQSPQFEIAPCLLDCLNQCIGYWLVERSHQEDDSGPPDAFGVFPFMLASCELFAQVNSPGQKLLSQMQIRTKGENLETAADVQDASGRPVLKMRGGYNRYFSWPMAFFLYLNHPQMDTYLSRDWSLPSVPAHIRRLDLLTREFMDSAHGIWKQALAHVVLSPQEREFWYQLPAKGPRRLGWLLGRLAAKEAVRSWSQQVLGTGVDSRQIEVLPDNKGRPVLTCQKLDLSGVNLSITHRKDCALACLTDDGSPVGIDLEIRAEPKETEWLRGAFSTHELSQWGTSYQQLLPLWSAKEAVVKAMGTGFTSDPKSWRIQHVDDQGRKVKVEHAGHAFEVQLWLSEQEVVAVCTHSFE